MLETFLRWVARALAGILERYADPDLEARLAAYNEQVKAQEQRIREAEDAARVSEAAYQTSLSYRNELNRRIAESEQAERELENELAESNKRIAETRRQAEEAKAVIDVRSDHDAVRGDV